MEQTIAVISPAPGNHNWAIPPVRLGLSGRNSGKIPERPRKRSQSISWNSRREYGWDAPSPIIQGISGFQSISRILSPPVWLGTPLFSEVVPDEGLPEPVMKFQAVLGVFLNNCNRGEIASLGARALIGGRLMVRA